MTDKTCTAVSWLWQVRLLPSFYADASFRCTSSDATCIRALAIIGKVDGHHWKSGHWSRSYSLEVLDWVCQATDSVALYRYLVPVEWYVLHEEGIWSPFHLSPFLFSPFGWHGEQYHQGLGCEGVGLIFFTSCETTIPQLYPLLRHLRHFGIAGNSFSLRDVLLSFSSLMKGWRLELCLKEISLSLLLRLRTWKLPGSFPQVIS